jgi:hypothetical protein
MSIVVDVVILVVLTWLVYRDFTRTELDLAPLAQKVDALNAALKGNDAESLPRVRPEVLRLGKQLLRERLAKIAERRARG